jgi:dimethylaniline monooxygenase (N-oxide forming)
VILCLGRFSGIPNIPQFPINQGPEQFHGKVLHSMDMCNMQNANVDELIKGNLVTVVGSGKSAYDILAECVAKNGKIVSKLKIFFALVNVYKWS